MSTITATSAPVVQPEEKNYLNVTTTFKSWALTHDHKRIGVMYLVTIAIFFAVGSALAGLIRAELTSPTGNFLESETYNRVFSAHGIIMIFFVLLAAVPGILGNFVIPLMIGARDVAFPRLNLLSYYFFIGRRHVRDHRGSSQAASTQGGRSTFHTRASTLTPKSGWRLTGVFLAGFSSIFTAVNFIVTDAQDAVRRA